MARFVEVFDRWDKGDWGTLGRTRAGRLEDGFFSARNMIVYDDGSIGPRPGVKARAYTGVPNGALLSSGYAFEFGAATQELFFVVGADLYAAPAFADGAVRTVATALAGGAPASATHDAYAVADNNVYLALADSGTGGRVYQWNRSTDAVSSIATTASVLNHITLHRDRLYACGQSPNRVYYSDAATPGTWTVATSFFDVGYNGALYAMGTVSNSLHIYMENGEWALSGVPESTSVLRELFVGGGLSPSSRGVVRVPDEGGAFWLPSERNAPVRSRAGIADRTSMEHLEDWGGAGDRGGAYHKVTRDLLFVDSSGNGLWRHNDVWTVHDFAQGSDGIIFPMQEDLFCLAVDGDASNPAAFYVLESDTNRPGCTSDDDAAPGDGSTAPLDAYLHLPEKWHPAGKEMRVTAVEVDFVSWNTGTTETAHFDLTVYATRSHAVGEASDGDNAGTTQSFDEAVASSSTSGTQRRIRMNVGDQGWGRGYQIRLTSIRNCSIRAVSVTVDDESRDAR